MSEQSEKNKATFATVMSLIVALFDASEYNWPFNEEAAEKIFEAETLIREWYLWPDGDTAENLGVCLAAFAEAAKFEECSEEKLSLVFHAPYNLIQSSLIHLAELTNEQQ